MPTPTTTFHAPGPNSAYIPQYGNPGATMKLQVMLSRNPASFAINRYLQIIPSAQAIGFYPVLNTTDQARVVNAQDAAWPDGNDRPSPNQRQMKWRNWRTTRFNYGVRLGNMTIEQSAVDLIVANSMAEAQRAMTARSIKAATVATTSGNYASTNVSADVDTLLSGSGLSWFSSSATDSTIQKSIHRMVEAVLKSSTSIVRPENLRLVLGPDVAHKMAETAEFHAWAQNNVASMQAAQESGIFMKYGLPPVLFGVNIEVEDCVKLTTRKGASESPAFVLGNAVFMCSQPGALVGEAPTLNSDGQQQVGHSFSTLSLFVKEDMVVEQKVDGWNRVTDIGIADDYDIQMTCPESGYLLSDVST